MSKFIRRTDILSKKDIRQLTNHMKKEKHIPAGIYGKNYKGTQDKSQRDTDRWEVFPEQFPNIAKKYNEYINEEGVVVNQFDLLAYGVNQHFVCHQDSVGKESKDGKNNLSGRVWSSTTLLDCSDDLEGGDLIIYGPMHPSRSGGGGFITKLKKGETVFFPSHFWHEVTPVRKGWRQVLIVWQGVSK